MPLDAKRAKFEINDREIKGYPIIWGNKNDYDEVVLQGATLKSLNDRGINAEGGNKILVLLFHEMHRPLCLPAELKEDDYGLFFRASINEGVSYCDDACASIRQGTLSQLSYGFNYVWGDNKTVYDGALDAYILREIDLYEISVVSFSSDPDAQIREKRDNLIASFLAKYGEKGLQNILNERESSLQQVENNDEFTNLLKVF
jgi:HK97 family phage prohead protease